MPSASSSDELTSLTRQIESNVSSNNHRTSKTLLTRAKIALLHQNALIPSSNTDPALLSAAQHILELGAIISIRLQDPASFTRYFQQLQPFYSPSSSHQQTLQRNQKSKITGLYLLLLLSQSDYAGFHTVLESLEVAAGQALQASGGSSRGKSLDDDEFVQYPIRLEQWLMEGSYDRVWEETKSERVPSEEFAMFSDVSLFLPCDLTHISTD